MEEDRRKVFMAFVYPMIGLCGLSVFIGSLLTNGWGGPQSFQIAMTNCCAVAVALFGGYFLAAYAINEMGTRMFGLHSNMPLTQQFAGYALVVSFLLQIVTGLLPDFRIIAWLLQFYIVYVVWDRICFSPFPAVVKESRAPIPHLIPKKNSMPSPTWLCGRWSGLQ